MGTGKTSLARALSDSLDNIKISVSHTTRSIRANEEPNKSYFFVDEPHFKSMINNHAFLEYAQVFDHYYGTSKQWVHEQLAHGIDIILDIDWQGAQLIRKQIDCTSIFLLPPSRQALHDRLINRKRENSSIIASRLAKASSEIAHYKEFDYIVVNDKFDHALDELKIIVKAQRLNLKVQASKHEKLIKDLLS